ncbi:MAG TPA: transcriptional repressor [Clostridia bacterium]|nr:transcriptional repressor [Clostridia bacterium]
MAVEGIDPMQCDDNKEVFNNLGIKNTKPRNLIYDMLKQADMPVTAEQIYLKLKESGETINLSTIYRVLDYFISKGIALKSSISDENKALFELNRMEHKHHIVCIECKKMFAIADCPFEDYEKRIESSLGFDVKGHKLEIFGYCSQCKGSK